ARQRFAAADGPGKVKRPRRPHGTAGTEAAGEEAHRAAIDEQRPDFEIQWARGRTIELDVSGKTGCDGVRLAAVYARHVVTRRSVGDRATLANAFDPYVENPRPRLECPAGHDHAATDDRARPRALEPAVQTWC